MPQDASPQRGSLEVEANGRNAENDESGDGSALPPFSPQAMGTSTSYISSASSTTGAGPHTPNMSTIDSSIRKNSDDVMKIPPAHPFFNQQHFVYDSDGSDGSLVMHKPKKSSAQQMKHSTVGTARKERFPSFDSMASSGSVRYVPSASPSAKSQPSQQPINPHLLPYHERRKLKQQRSKQMQQQQQQQQYQIPAQAAPQFQPQRYDPRVHPNYQQQQFAMMMQQTAQGYPPAGLDPMAAAAFASMYGMPMPGYPGMPFPSTQGYPPSQPPPNSYTNQQQQQPVPSAPFMQHFPPPFGMVPPPPQNQPRQSMPPQAPQQPPSPPTQQHSTQYQPQSLAAAPQQPTSTPQAPPPQQQRHLSPYRTIGKQERPPKGNSAPRGASAARPPIAGGSKPRPHLNSADSSDSSNRRRNEQPPPPPPPPQPPLPPNVAPNPYHIRADSVGSLSSLGSAGAAVGEHDDILPRKNSSGGGFLDMLRSWSPKQQPQQQQQNIIDFHRKNQEFLQTSQRSRTPLPSPKSASHRRIPSEDMPPATRGTHKRLHSITNDDWEEKTGKSAGSGAEGSSGGSGYSSSDASAEDGPADESTSLLPAAGISTNERDGKDNRHYRKKRTSRRRHERGTNVAGAGNSGTTEEAQQLTSRWDNRTASAMVEQAGKSSSRKHRKKKHKSRRKSSRHKSGDDDDDDSSDSSYDYRVWTQKRARMLEKERNKLIEQWKAEARMEAELSRREEESNRWYRKAGRSLTQKLQRSKIRAYRTLTLIEAFIANIPLTIGAVAMAVVTLGVVWFKFAEENIDTCEPVHFHSSQCTFPEFPGCFYCDTNAPLYKTAIYFHWACKVSAGILAMLFVAKVIVATRVVLDEMSQPTTASPAGLLCMTAVCVFAGRGVIGQIMVTSAACVHLCIVIWSIYMALAYHIMPDPSWYPNTVGIGLTAVKTWLYYPMPGHLLMAISLSLNLCFFPISLVRVVLNPKISATNGWMQMSAPAISLYALTIMAQPSFEEEHPDVTQFQRVHRMVYLPCMHVMCLLSLLGFAASVLSLYTRWNDFKLREFSPAHAAFCFPTLSHANAIQAYRGAVISFSNIHHGSWRMILLYNYWLIVLLTGTISTVWITIQFLACLPRWTNLDIEDEEEPPAPYETVMYRQDVVTAGEMIRQPFVSPAILQANETGALVLARNAADGRVRYVRSRRIRALGFEPTMSWSELQSERQALLDYVGSNPSRRRHRTLSVPGIDFNYGSNLGTGNSGVYGAIGTTSAMEAPTRADSGSPRIFL